MRSRRLVALAALVGAAVAAAVLLLPHDPRAGSRTLVRAAGPLARRCCSARPGSSGTPLLVPGHAAVRRRGGFLFGPLGVAVSLLGSPLGALAAFAPRGCSAPTARAAAAQAGLRRSSPGWSARLPRRPVLRDGPRDAGLRLRTTRAGHARARPRLPRRLGRRAAPRVVLYGVLGGTIAHAGLLSAGIGAAVALAPRWASSAAACTARRRLTRARLSAAPRPGAAPGGRRRTGSGKAAAIRRHGVHRRRFARAASRATGRRAPPRPPDRRSPARRGRYRPAMPSPFARRCSPAPPASSRSPPARRRTGRARALRPRCTPQDGVRFCPTPTSPRACRASTARRSTSTSRCPPPATGRSRRSCCCTGCGGTKTSFEAPAATRTTTACTSRSRATPS